MTFLTIVGQLGTRWDVIPRTVSIWQEKTSRGIHIEAYHTIWRTIHIEDPYLMGGLWRSGRIIAVVGNL